jgi:hypothetical protein
MQQTIPRWKNIKFSSILWLNCKPSKLPPEQIEIQWEAIDDNNR